MRKTLLVALTGAFMVAGVGMMAQAEMASLRGANPLDSDSKQFDRRKQETMEGGFQKSWKQQPPSIPHKIDKDEITLQVNTCLRCHDTGNFEKEKAPKVGDSHFITAGGETLEKLDGRRYFCTQCHATQLNVDPLIENVFQTVKQP